MRRFSLIIAMLIILTAILPGVAAADAPDAHQVLGYIFEDMDANGLFTAADQAQSGIVVRLYQDNAPLGVWNSADTLVDAIRSNSDGLYSFANLNAGHYLLVQMTPLGFDCSTGDIISLDLGGPTLLTADQLSFGNVYAELYPTISHKLFMPSVIN